MARTITLKSSEVRRICLALSDYECGDLEEWDEVQCLRRLFESLWALDDSSAGSGFLTAPPPVPEEFQKELE